MRFLVLVLVLIAGPTWAQPNSQAPQADVWAALRALEGTWRGESNGAPGQGTSTRTYKFIQGGKFLQGETTTVYPPQEKNPKGETHTDIALFSHNRAAKAFALRQFHVEGFVNTYAQQPFEGALRFVTTDIENIPAGFIGRETYRFNGADEVTETFEIAEPGKEFSVYSETRLKRVK
ncbi:MAG: hypothetical protein JNK21_15785 [Rhodospirillaceae bacterium]|nr:hypothetical protein [Rhodospirillaceae bacterium]